AVHADVALAVALEVGADELARRPLEDLDDPARRAKTGTVRLLRDLDEDLVAGGGVEGVILTDEDFRPGPAVDGVRADEAEAGRRPAVDADGGAVRRRGADGLVLAQLDAALADQVFERPAEVAVFPLRNAQLTGQRLRLDRLVVPPRDGGQDLVFEFGH